MGVPDDRRLLDTTCRMAEALLDLLPLTECAADRLAAGKVEGAAFAADSIRTALLPTEMGTVAQLKQALGDVAP